VDASFLKFIHESMLRIFVKLAELRHTGIEVRPLDELDDAGTLICYSGLVGLYGISLVVQNDTRVCPMQISMVHG